MNKAETTAKEFLEKLQEEINTANNRSAMQGDNAIEKARLEGKRDGLIMVKDELKKLFQKSAQSLKGEGERQSKCSNISCNGDIAFTRVCETCGKMY